MTAIKTEPGFLIFSLFVSNHANVISTIAEMITSSPKNAPIRLENNSLKNNLTSKPFAPNQGENIVSGRNVPTTNRIE